MSVAAQQRPYAALVAEAVQADVTGWGFAWLAGRAAEERPPWGYARLPAQRLASVGAALDLDIGAVVWLLRTCVWWVSDCSVERYAAGLRELDRQLRSDGPFVAHSTRHLVLAHRPGPA